MNRYSAMSLAFLLTLPLMFEQLHSQSQIKTADLGRFALESGAIIEQCRMGFVTAGALNYDSTNAILFVPWFSGTVRSALSFVGAGKLVDSSKYYVVSVGTFGDGVSSSPSNSNAQGGAAFPKYTIRDMVTAQYQLVSKVLKLRKLHGVIGISMGGMLAFQWVVSYPEFVAKAVSIVGTPQVNSYDLLRWETELEVIDALQKCNSESSGRFVALWETIIAQTPDRIAQQNPRRDFENVSKKIGERKFDPYNRISQIRAVMTMDIASQFGSSLERAASIVEAQMFVVTAVGDQSVHPGPAIEFAKLLNAKTIALSGGCGHLSPWCEEQTLAPLVSSFFEDKK